MKKIGNIKKENVMTVAALLAACAIGISGGTLAYLTDHEEVKNEFVVGKVDIEEEEPDYHPDEDGKTSDIVPGQEIPKNPLLKNVGENDAFVYMDVSIPIAQVVTADDNGNRLNNGEAQETELFSLENLQLSGEEQMDGWNLMYQKKSGDYMVYVYNYDSILKPGESTKPLFTSVKFANIIEGQLDQAQLEIPVRSYAIQTVNTSDGKGSVREQATQAWEKYYNQNSGQEGAATAGLN
ncbi:MAG: TasA family protein [Fusicatenibacter sp.]|nr:TasA family protein [Lachnospiraceae bacterium]MDY2937486.1 TasA family protein [Fusicatenibacter sp.]